MTFLAGPVHVSVPATSANLGPGYDCLGLALEWRDELTACVGVGELSITVEGKSAESVPKDDSHLVVRAMTRGFEAMGLPKPGLSLHCRNAVPHARGLGSSASAIVGGLCLARGLVSDPGQRLTDDALLEIAADMEGHPDNVAAALFGGLVISGERSPEELATSEGSRFFALQSEVQADLVAVVFVPEFEVETKLARGLLPTQVTHQAASENASRVALLIAAIATAPDLLHTATRDFLHQDFRASAMPETLALVHRLRSQGLAAVVSGAGPTVLVLTRASDANGLLSEAPAGWASHVVAIDKSGARTS